MNGGIDNRHQRDADHNRMPELPELTIVDLESGTDFQSGLVVCCRSDGFWKSLRYMSTSSCETVLVHPISVGPDLIMMEENELNAYAQGR